MTPFLLRNSSDLPTVPGDPRSSINAQAFLTQQLAIALLIGVPSFLLFCSLRTRCSSLYNSHHKRTTHTHFPNLPSTPFSWISTILYITDDQILQGAGLDVFVFLSFFKMAIKFLLAASIFAWILVAPLNRYTGGSFTLKPPLHSADGNPSLLWAYVLFVYAFSGITCYFLWNQTRKITDIRQTFLGHSNSVTERTVRIKGVPSHLRSENSLSIHLASLDIGNIESVLICRDWRSLDALVSLRKHNLQKLKQLSLIHPQSPPNRLLCEYPPRPRIKLGFLGVFGRSIDAIDYYSDIIQKLDAKINLARNKVYPPTGNAFVTFSNSASAQLAAQAVLDKDPLSIIAKPACPPKDVLWNHAHLSRRSRAFRSAIAFILSTAIVVLWFFPVGAIAAILNINTIRKFLPGFAAFLEKTTLGSVLVQGFLPTLAFVLFNALVPYLFDVIALHQGFVSRGDAELSVVSKNFFYLFFNFFLIFTIAGTISNLYAMAKDTTQIPITLAASLPRVAGFYVNLIVLQGIAIFPLRLLQIGDLLTYPFNRTPGTSPTKEDPAPLFHYGFLLPLPIMIFILCLVYSILEPKILLFGLVYFVVGYLVYKYQLLYSMQHPHHSTGKAWMMIIRRLVVGLVVFQLTMSGMLSLRKAYQLSAAILPLVFSSSFVFYPLINRAFTPLSLHISLESIHQPSQDTTRDQETLHYVNPSMVEELEEFRA